MSHTEHTEDIERIEQPYEAMDRAIATKDSILMNECYAAGARYVAYVYSHYDEWQPELTEALQVPVLNEIYDMLTPANKVIFCQDIRRHIEDLRNKLNNIHNTMSLLEQYNPG